MARPTVMGQEGRLCATIRKKNRNIITAENRTNASINRATALAERGCFQKFQRETAKLGTDAAGAVLGNRMGERPRVESTRSAPSLGQSIAGKSCSIRRRILKKIQSFNCRRICDAISMKRNPACPAWLHQVT